MARALVIGGTGFIGSRVVRRLVGRSYTVCVAHRGKTHASLPPEVTTAVADRDDVSAVADLARSFHPDVTLDMIALTEAQARAVTTAVRGVCPRVVVVSSADVYRNYDGLRHRGTTPPDPVPLTEEAPLRDTRFPYRGMEGTLAAQPWVPNYEKILVEQSVMGSSGMVGTVVRLSKVYGPGDPQGHLDGYLDLVLAGDGEVTLEKGRAGWRWTRCQVDDVAEAIAVAVATPAAAGRIYNAGEHDALTEAEWVREVARAARRAVTVREEAPSVLPSTQVMGLDWRYPMAVATERIRRELGFQEIVGRAAGVRQTVAAALARKGER